MSYNLCYTFFDSAEVAFLWKLSWRSFLKRFPKTEPRVRELIAFATAGPEPQERWIDKTLATRSIPWTIRRASFQCYFMSELAGFVPRLSKHFVTAETGYVQEPPWQPRQLPGISGVRCLDRL